MRYFPPSFSSLSSHQDSEWVDFKNDPDSESRLCFLTLKLNHLSSSQFLKKLGFWTRNSLYVSMSRASVTDNENCDLRLCRIQLQISCRCKEIYICIHTHTHTHTHFHGDDLFDLCPYLNKNGWSESSEKDKLGWEGVTLRNIRNLYYTTAQETWNIVHEFSKATTTEYNRLHIFTNINLYSHNSGS